MPRSYEKKSKEEISEEMDEAAKFAEVELGTLAINEVLPVANWFKTNYLKAGHKRLGRILINYTNSH